MSKTKTKFLQLEDINIAYKQEGTGPALILLHGNSQDKRIFKQFQKKYFTSFTTYAIDSRGHGKSKSYDNTYTIKQLSDDIIHFCKAKKIDQAYVVGYSDGGNIALFLAKNAPNIFNKIVAISPNYLVGGIGNKTLKLFIIMLQIMKVFKRVGIRTDKSIMKLNLMLRDIGITEEELSTINCNIKILYAEKDIIKEDHIKKLAGLLPNAKIEKICKSNHFNIIYKKQMIKGIDEFFKSTS
ncbi:pimeloyl-ACP methyl ester carboxylesterase [Natranaerovirga pectinivora]|uniref:Pimeloyl-ACP methyl ester carboxylesterase n=1 Tax=Natranaerovirga pectinivora TaxID=682400 RepID=A0A4R3MNH6_9FIRM|nr:alpha/beta hydrolase [Natranaerovirga pectinivora]TCT15594.1 pimeloyl-ACP methyl ester carboxylesterase [Natranaerovirga pectinivora]